ncbi:hypothetical protein [Nonomuraea sp. NPDC049400]|uniref:hypothetical protein n=1 Tax=Nonomuraea sp. NPDC049400 TaxID=3364352 RepID=UPI0037B55881
MTPTPRTGPAMMLQLVAGQWLVLRELTAIRRDQIEFVQQWKASEGLSDARLLPGLQRGAQLLAEARRGPTLASPTSGSPSSKPRYLISSPLPEVTT